ncbi:MAG TPA: transcriptional repressor [Deltaproteobacteria bacterium]|nr:transcriptional repressor [Deltaproteobacteria bacterium]
MSRQRGVILEEIRKVRTHPTASDVYDLVKERLPRISLGTVYRNLEQLAAEGLILKLDLGTGQRRFDACTDDHVHIRCASCGRVDDVPLQRTDAVVTMYEGVARATGYDVSGCEIDFVGVCPACRARDAAQQTKHDKEV